MNAMTPEKKGTMQTTLSQLILLILHDAYLFSIRHFKQIVTLCLPFVFASTLFGFVFAKGHQETPMALIGPWMINLLVYPIYTAALIHFMARRARNDMPSNKALLMAAIQQWPQLFLLRILLILIFGLGITLLMVPVMFLGIPLENFLLYLIVILPVFWLAIRLAYAEFYLVLYGDRCLDAIRKSFLATGPHFLLLLVLLSSTYMPILFLGFASDQFIQSLTSNDFFRIMAGTGWSLVLLFVHIVLFRAYMETVKDHGLT
jgi:hypothetical protein